MNKTIAIIVTVVIILGTGIFLLGESKDETESVAIQTVQNVEMRDGIQYITIHARGGYSPKITTAQANIPTTLIVKTNGTYDCSSALVIRAIDYQKILPQTGEEIIELGVPQKGKFQGTCSMGMYNFTINFE